MNTWTSKGVLTAALLALSACADGGSLAFLNSDENARRNVALVSTTMAQGALKLVPPDGFCIDKRGLRSDFAVLARCDSLGGRGGAQDASLGMMLVSVTPVSGDVDSPDLLEAVIPPETETLSTDTRGDLALARVRGPVPEGAANQYWRGLVQIGAHLVGLTAYVPEGSDFDGGDALTVLAVRTQETSVALAAPSDAAGQQAKGGKFLRGLFNRKALAQ